MPTPSEFETIPLFTHAAMNPNLAQGYDGSSWRRRLIIPQANTKDIKRLDMAQAQLPFFPDGTTEINANLAFEKQGELVTYLYGHLPVFQHHVDDRKTFRLITSQLYVNGNASQAELCRAFGVTSISSKLKAGRISRAGLSAICTTWSGRS